MNGTYTPGFEDFDSVKKLLESLTRRDPREGIPNTCHKCRSPYLVTSTYPNPEFCILCSTDRVTTVNKNKYREQVKLSCRRRTAKQKEEKEHTLSSAG